MRVYPVPAGDAAEEEAGHKNHNRGMPVVFLTGCQLLHLLGQFTVIADALPVGPGKPPA